MDRISLSVPFVVTFLLLVAGCGQAPTEIDLQDPLRTLAVLEAQQQQQAADLYMEVDLGEFFVVKKQPGSPYGLGITCHLYGVIPNNAQGEFESVLSKRQQRMRDSIIVQIQSSESSILVGSDLALLKSDLLKTCRHALQSNLVQRVVISDFSVEQH